MFSKIFIFCLISIAIYFGISTVLIFFGIPKERNANKKTLTFNGLRFDYSGLPEIEQFQARDGEKLSYRHYTSQSDLAVILLHGSGWHSQYFLPLAGFMSSNGLAWPTYTHRICGGMDVHLSEEVISTTSTN